MDSAVKLAKLPDGLQFPDRLQDRVRYDAECRELRFRGFMTKCTYDELSALSEDADYHRALERLFVLTSSAAEPPQRRMLPAAIAATVAATAIAAAALWFGLRQGGQTAPANEDVVATTMPSS